MKRFDGGKGDETPGAAHRNKDGVPIPTPHINHKNGEVRKPTEEPISPAITPPKK